MDQVINILLGIAGLSLLVIAHEAGHYLVARAFGMRVLRFSIGFGPTIFKYQPKDSPTVFQVGAIPFLAYVMIAGMNPFEENDENDRALYCNQNLFARAATVFAGPAANYLLAVIIMFLFSLAVAPRVGVTGVMEGSPAASAGVKPGDTFITANDKPIKQTSDLIEVCRARPDMPTPFVLERDGKQVPLSITPEKKNDGGVIGVAIGVTESAPGLPAGEALTYSLSYPVLWTKLQVQGIADALTRRTTEDIADPITMVRFLGKEVDRGWMDFIKLLVILSIALGAFNLLPFPALDGGRLFFLAYESITRQRPNPKFEAITHLVGIVLLLSLVGWVTIRNNFIDDPLARLGQPEPAKEAPKDADEKAAKDKDKANKPADQTLSEAQAPGSKK